MHRNKINESEYSKKVRIEGCYISLEVYRVNVEHCNKNTSVQLLRQMQLQSPNQSWEWFAYLAINSQKMIKLGLNIQNQASDPRLNLTLHWNAHRFCFSPTIGPAQSRGPKGHRNLR